MGGVGHMNFIKQNSTTYLYFNFFIMKERLLEILEENRGTITEAVINEILDDDNPLQTLLNFDA